MFSRIHEKLGTAGFVISIVALLAALTGGAYAAGALNPQVKKQITKESKKFSKKFSKQFAVAGPQGAKGDTGAQGAKGDTGARGSAGERGERGEQGLTGEPGETGFTATLPEGETETGAWAFGLTASNSVQLVSTSFNIPLEAAPTVHVIQANGKEKVLPGPVEIEQPLCPGNVAEPAAEPGTLCLYTDTEVNLTFAAYPAFTKTYATGAVVAMLPSATGARANGTWAVTAP